MAAPTFVGVTAVPADNGAQAGPTITIDKDAGALASAQAGDLVVVVTQYKALSSTSQQVYVNEAGGQNWNSLRGVNTSSHNCRIFYCRFNGTWSADPTWSHFVVGTGPSGTLALTGVATVWRPDNAADWWVVCNGPINTTFTAGTTPFTKTITGLTPRLNDTVTLAVWSTADDNTWGSLSGTNWTQGSLAAQYRNTQGTDQSLAIAYQLQGTAAATNNVSLNQATLGGDAGGAQIVSFAALTMPAGTNVTSPVYVQGDRDYSHTSTTTLTSSLGSNVGNGNALIGTLNYETTTDAEVVSVETNNGDDLIELARWCDYLYDQAGIMFWRPGITAASTSSVVATMSPAAPFCHLIVIEAAGLGSVNIVANKVTPCDDIFAPFNPATVSRTPTADNCFLVGSAVMTGGGDGVSPTYMDDADGWTIRFAGVNDAPDQLNVLHTQLQTTATAEDYDIDVPTNVSATSAANVWAAFNPAVSSGTTIAGGIGSASAQGLAGAIVLTTSIAAAVGSAAAQGLQAAVPLHTSIDGAIGTAAASGLAVSLSATTGIAATVGEAAASGLPAAIALATTVAAGTGEATASGLAAAIVPSTAIAAAIGAAAASGQPAAVTLSLNIAAEVGIAAASGLAASIQLGSGTTIAAQVGVAEASGLPTTIAEHTAIAAALGEAAASGPPASVTLPTSIAAGTAEAAAAGLPAELALHTSIAAAVAEATAVGLPASLSGSVNIAATVGQASALGLQAGIAQTTTLAAGIGAAAASGEPAAIALAVSIAAAVGTAAASGPAAVIQVGSGTTIAGQVGAAEASGLPATLAEHIAIAATVGAASATGLQATIQPATLIAAGIATAAASGPSATIVTATVIAAGVAAAQAAGLGTQIVIGTAWIASAPPARAAQSPAARPRQVPTAKRANRP